MKKLCYLLSIAIHILVWIFVVHARFTVTIHPQPPKMVTIRVVEPPPPYFPGNVPAQRSQGNGSPAAAGGITGASTAPGAAKDAGTGPSLARGALPFPAAGDFRLQSRPAGTFRLAPVGKSPEPWAVPLGPSRSPGLQRFSAGAYRPGAGAGGASGGIFLLPFDIHEKPVADWTHSVLARIERNWIIPASGRLAFSGRVQITLTIERQGNQRTLVIDDSSVPEPLTLAALHAVQASLPLPPIPENVAGQSLAFTFIFSYNG